MMYFVVIPAQIEEPLFADYTTPATVPNIAVLGIVVFAIIQLIENLEPIPIDFALLGRTLLFGVLGMVAVWIMGVVHFPFVAPFLSLAIMALIGERRRNVMAYGFVIPIIIYFLVEIVLVRPLP